MLFRQEFLDGIRAGAITLAFRRWQRPTVRAGGTLLTAVGQLAIGSVSRVAEAAISRDDARRAGFASRDALLAELNRRSTGDIYRIELRALRPDPRIELRDALPDNDGTDVLIERLRRLDAHAREGAWTARVLDLIAAHPSLRAGDLCELAGMEKLAFKANVRKLKTLGLTESLEIGYRLSLRGQAIRTVLRSAARRS